MNDPRWSFDNMLYPFKITSLSIENFYPDGLSPAGLGAGADGNEQVHLRSEIDVGLFFWTNHRIVHSARLGIDAHALEDIERARHIVRRNIPWLHCSAEILPATVVGNLLRFLGINIDPFDKNALGLALRDHLESLPAAHPFLQIVAAFREAVFDDGQHRIIPLRKERIAGADENLYLIRLGSRLIEPLVQIIKVKGYEIDDAPARDPQPLTFFDFKCRTGIFRHDLVL
jgi:hypothetical protein